ncbi:geranylgeranyl transferase type-2 subunit alpha 1 [Punica granatum]|uniref:Geranylgeranyl transferase type-2 subunit alpha n=2 Tax=Punica granatum TaxID=22663 RepID=A0A218W4Z5_PUNGR|nr:geranylgeranyl transferase type-2 subunit alpha 1 [Punica granatum]OWM67706.1 hypothetical protein CDL15_Pgr019207 [Punica granatum]PKI73510.1 hypothetical protein CRG98_006091 [Punica granatum]
MHGRPRMAPNPEDAAASAAKSQKLRSLQSQFLSFHHSRTYTKEALEISAKLLEINPENYTAWNYRKLAVEHCVKESESDPSSVKSIFDKELKVVESALRQNFKSYGAWHHRKWVLSKGHSSIDEELRLLDKLQKQDSRNFHAWNYRRFVAALMNRSIEDELKYTENLIENNFSNYSAWHNRSILLSELVKKKDQGSSTQDVLSEEYNFVRDALFTDPDDQSAWFYHLWLLQQTIQSKAPLLVSSWPANGADLRVSGNGCLGGASGLFSRLSSDLRRFPLVLFFNQNVEGISSLTVTVEASFITSKDLTWKSLSPKTSRFGRVWVAYLDISSVDLDYLNPQKVVVRLGHCPGIMSSSGLPLSKPFRLEYTIAAKPIETKSSGRHENEIFQWKEDDFHNSEGQLEESIPRLLYTRAVEDNDEAAASRWHIDTMTEEINHVRVLLASSDCKIGKLMLARLLMARDDMLSPYANKMAHSEEVLELYRDLIRLDPPHSHYYKDQSSLVLMQQLVSSRDSLLKHCFCYEGIKSSSIDGPVCLRLNNLSLSRVGSFEKLLWVHILDLSDNELHSIQGIEALQLLSCLNLRSNKLTSFSALEPLRSLKCLRALNISYNEIGSHPIDTCRYLVTSPLSHSAEISWNRDEDLPDGVDVENYWEAFLVFKDLDLVQLDIAGNPVADERFQSFLVKITPELTWLDGQKLH